MNDKKVSLYNRKQMRYQKYSEMQGWSNSVENESAEDIYRLNERKYVRIILIALADLQSFKIIIS